MWQCRSQFSKLLEQNSSQAYFMEDAVRAKMLLSEGSAKKSKKALRRKVSLDGAVCAYGDEAGMNVTQITEGQSMPSVRPKRSEIGNEAVLNVTQITERRPKKRKKTHREEIEQNVRQEPSTRKKQEKFNPTSSTVSLIQRSVEGQSKGIMTANENGTEEERESNKNDPSWVQRASWKSLVGATGRVAFSLGSVLGNMDLPVASTEQPSTAVHSSKDRSPWIDATSSFPSSKPPYQSSDHLEVAHARKNSSSLKKFKSQDDFGSSIQQCVGTDDAQGDLTGSAKGDHTEKPECEQISQSLHQNGVHKNCTFMRSENYEEEWLAAKRAVKEIFKRSRKDALRSVKMFHTRHTT